MPQSNSNWILALQAINDLSRTALPPENSPLLETLMHTLVRNGNEVISSTRKQFKPSITKEAFQFGTILHQQWKLRRLRNHNNDGILQVTQGSTMEPLERLKTASMRKKRNYGRRKQLRSQNKGVFPIEKYLLLVNMQNVPEERRYHVTQRMLDSHWLQEHCWGV